MNKIDNFLQLLSFEVHSSFTVIEALLIGFSLGMSISWYLSQ